MRTHTRQSTIARLRALLALMLVCAFALGAPAAQTTKRQAWGVAT